MSSTSAETDLAVRCRDRVPARFLVEAGDAAIEALFTALAAGIKPGRTSRHFSARGEKCRLVTSHTP